MMAAGTVVLVHRLRGCLDVSSGREERWFATVSTLYNTLEQYKIRREVDV